MSAVTKPIVTVLLPVYNAEKYLAEAVTSILQQSYTDFEFLIINDGSTDSSPEILREFQARDPRIKLINNTNQGLIKTLNQGLSIAQGEFIARMDADDIAMPHRLQRQVEIMQADPELAVLGSNIEIIDARGQKIRIGKYPRSHKAMQKFITVGSPFAHPAVMLRRSLVTTVGGYREKYTHAEDYDLWLRLYEQGYRLDNLPEVLLRYRQHDSSISRKHAEQQRLVTLYAQITHKMRLAGLDDPSISIDKITPEALNDIPEPYKLIYTSREALLNFPNIHRAEATKIYDALSKLNAQKDYLDKELLATFYLKATIGLLREKAFLSALKLLAKSVFTLPTECIKVVYRRFAAA